MVWRTSANDEDQIAERALRAALEVQVQLLRFRKSLMSTSDKALEKRAAVYVSLEKLPVGTNSACN